MISTSWSTPLSPGNKGCTVSHKSSVNLKKQKINGNKYRKPSIKLPAQVATRPSHNQQTIYQQQLCTQQHQKSALEHDSILNRCKIHLAHLSPVKMTKETNSSKGRRGKHKYSLSYESLPALQHSQNHIVSADVWMDSPKHGQFTIKTNRKGDI